MNIVILTGAGISAESGLATFTGADGLWNGHRIEDVCTPDALERNPDAVCAFYDERKSAAASSNLLSTAPIPNGTICFYENKSLRVAAGKTCPLNHPFR